MSDQPKPTETGCTCNRENRGALQHSSHCLVANRPPKPAGKRTQCLLCGQIIPTQEELAQPKPTGEWTPEWLRRVITEHWNEPEREVICRAHKAALASADERLLSDDRKNLSAAAIALTKADTQIMELREQLAAEREKTREFAELAVKAERELNAEREKVTIATQMAQIESKRANEAEQEVQNDFGRAMR